MHPEMLRLEIDARGVATLTLARPDKHNAMNAQLIDELAWAAGELSTRPARAAVLAAEGRSFSAGGDLAWMRAQMEADRATRMAEARRLAAMLGRLDAVPVPLIARVQGQAFGGGLGLMAVADVVIAAEGVMLGFTETRLGLIPATIGPYVAARMGPRIRTVFASARPFDAAEGVRLGLVSRVVAAEALDEAVEAEIAPCLKVAPGAAGRAKGLLRSLGLAVSEAAVETSITALADQWETEEAEQGIAAFFDRRPTPWSAP
ncbi:MAG: crotonase/enoyl-CoA hydratase family protein [Pseudomonadota bacterium]